MIADPETRTGVRCVAVLSGGTGRDELTEAGAISVFADPQDLLDHLGQTPLG